MNLIPLGIFLLLSIWFVVHIKKSKKSFSVYRQAVIFFGYLFSGATALMVIMMIIKIPKIISSENQLKGIIQNENFLIVEGDVENYQIKKSNGQYFESFTIHNVTFEYSDFIVINGFHQTSKNNGPIYKNGQFFRISYINSEDKNIILKIEKNVFEVDENNLDPPS